MNYQYSTVVQYSLSLLRLTPPKGGSGPSYNKGFIFTTTTNYLKIYEQKQQNYTICSITIIINFTI